MKHTFVFIDKLAVLLKVVPRISLHTKEDKVKAKKSLLLIKEYTRILRKLIESHKTKKYLHRLLQAHIKEVENWAEHVTATFKNLDSLLVVLERDAKKLAYVIDHEPEQWQHTIVYMAFGMFQSALHDEEENMKRLRNVAVFEIHELEAIIDHEKHVRGLHEWKKIDEFSQDEQIIKQEEFFVELLS